jgi:hypothetical protein
MKELKDATWRAANFGSNPNRATIKKNPAWKTKQDFF